MIKKTLLCVAMLAPSLIPQTADARRPARPPAERPAEFRNDVANYLKSKTLEFAANDRGLAAVGKSQNFVPLYNLLKDKGSFGGRPVKGKSDQEQAAVRDALTKTAAYYLAATGMTPSEVTRLIRNGYDPISAVERVIAGGSTLDDDLAVAETPIFGKLVDSVASGPDASERKLTFTVERNVKGRAGLTEQVSFAVTPSHPVGSLAKGTSCLLLLSDTLGRFRAASGKPKSSTSFQQQLEPYCQVGAVFQRVSSEASANISGTELIAAIDKMASAK
ncbi:MAG TPA: hypothetical protein VF574_00940 [Allosphingosinicella sp.]|jgi:hypothetical protein